jgi:hypothetical protein
MRKKINSKLKKIIRIIRIKHTKGLRRFIQKFPPEYWGAGIP